MKLELLDGFYAKESDSINFWYWAYKNEVVVCLKNDNDEPLSVSLEFIAIPPIGIEKKEFTVCTEKNNRHFIAPCTYKKNFFLEGNQEQIIKINISGAPITVDNGDTRQFMLMFQNITIKEAEEKYTNLREVQKVEVDLLNKVVDMCIKYDLHCYLFYGSLLGCIRDGEMIPWDDDVDIVLLRDEYDKLIYHLKNELEWPYFLQAPENTDDAFFGGYCKLRNMNTTGAVIKKGFNRLLGQGIWIDIIPLDVWIDNKDAREKQLKTISKLQKKIIGTNNHRLLRGKRKKLIQKLHNQFVTGDKNEEYVTVLARILEEDRHHFYPKAIFDGKQYAEFEGININIPSDSSICLTTDYGKNYSIFPDEINRVPRHSALYRPNIPWDTYSKKLISKENVYKKEHILICKKEFLDDYFREVEKPCIQYIIDDENSGTLYKGIMIITFEQLKKFISDDMYVVIYDENYIDVEHHLTEINHTNYGIYICERFMKKSEMKHLCTKVRNNNATNSM